MKKSGETPSKVKRLCIQKTCRKHSACLQALRQSTHREADCQFSFIRRPEPQKADNSVNGLDDGGLLPLAVMAFKLLVKSRAGARNADEFGSRFRVVTLRGGKFSEVRARCTSGRRRTTSVVGSGGNGKFGGGTGGGLRRARRALTRAVSGREWKTMIVNCSPHRTTRTSASRTSAANSARN